MPAQRLTYTTDLTDEEWQILKPLLPPEKSGGRPRQDARREVSNGLQSVRRGGGAWRLMPHARPHWPTGDQTFRAWRRDGTWRRLHDQRRERVRPPMGRHPQPSAAVIDAQTVKTTGTGGRPATMAPNNATAVSAIASWRRRVSSCGSSAIPPL